MTPIPNARNPSEDNYNIAHRKTRHLVENCIGVLKNRFRAIIKERVLLYSPAVVGMIINTAVILHNILIKEKYPIPNLNELQPEQELQPQLNLDNHLNLTPIQIIQRGREVRNNLIRRFF